MSGMPAQKSIQLTDLVCREDFISFPERIRNVAKRNPDLEVLKVDGVSRTWAQMISRVNQVSNMLASRGLGRGNTVAILAKSSLGYVEIFLGTLQAGLCVTPLSGMASSEQLEAMVRDSGASMLFASANTIDHIDPFKGKIDAIPEDGYIALDFTKADWSAYEDLLGGVSADEMIVDIQPEDPFNLIYSSGTTGVPKGIEQSHAMRNQHVIRFEGMGVTADAVTLTSTALYSNTTLVVMLPTLALGGRIVLMPKFDAEGYLKLAEAEKVSHTMLVPVQYQRILAHEDFDKYDLSSFQVKMSTSAPLREGVKIDAMKRWPGKLLEIYGLTEGGIGTLLSVTESPDKLASVGQPGAGVELRLINDDGVEVPPGEIGEIVGRSDAMMSGYHNRPDLTDEMIWTSPDGGIFLKSGDVGRFDEDGFLFLLDRKKDMILSGGFNIYATDIEVELVQHPAVIDAAVIAIPSEEWGETPLAIVVRKEDTTDNALDIKEWVNARLGKTQRISGVEFADELPRNTIGKIMKRELRDRFVG